ncbi:MAG: NADH-quinone oxidoreductase subunit A [Gemmataceae bacterium]|nr:NADH-quinone oxidoreductase subunit A [Gemmataceae bacterium]
MDFDLSTYYPILIYAVLIGCFAAGALIASHILGPRKDTKVKGMPYESGMDPLGDAKKQFDVRFYIIAILFLVFDVELLFIYPWAASAYGAETSTLPLRFSTPAFVEMVLFTLTLLIGYVYAWKAGVFQWR